MARVTANVGFNTLDPHHWTGRPTFLGSNQMTVTDGTNTTILKGYGLTYSWDGRLVGGTVTSYQSYQGEQLRGTVDSFAVSASTAQYYVGSGDYTGFFRVLQQNDDYITGSANSDRLYVGGGRDQVYAGGGDDFIGVSRGEAFIDGGAGRDTVYLPGIANSYGQTQTAAGWQFWNNSAGINVNLANVERVAFSDGVLAFDVNGSAGQMYRLYQAAFDRRPDPEGLTYWVGEFDTGRPSLSAVAESFINSPEGRSVYGTNQSVSNAQFVELLYIHTLGRDYDQSGYNYWVGKLNTGATNRPDLLAFFSESNENKARVADDIHDGIWLI